MHDLNEIIFTLKQEEASEINQSDSEQIAYLTKKWGKKGVENFLAELENAPKAPAGTIVIFENKEISTQRGSVIATGYIESEGYIPDLYVAYNRFENLYNDKTFMSGVDKILSDLGFQQKVRADYCDRAELGMQERKVAVIEPSKNLANFFIEKFGFSDLS